MLQRNFGENLRNWQKEIVSMASLNESNLIGYLGSDPQMKIGRTGKAYCRVDLATSDGTNEKPWTEWHRLVLFGRAAEVADQFAKKGSQVYVKGRIKTHRWTDSAGVERAVKEVMVNYFQLLDRKAKDGQPEVAPPVLAPPLDPVPPDDDPFVDLDELPDGGIDDLPF
jgi:single-strand DNA-binding protein